MKLRLFLNAALVALALGSGALVWVTRDAPTTADREARKNKLLTTFKLDAVERIRLTRSGQQLELARKGASDDFRIVRPWAERADTGGVRQLLTSLELASWLRPADDLNRAALGLASPALVIELQIAEKTSRISLGGAAPAPSGARYAEIESDGEVRHVVLSPGVAMELDVPFDKFRETRLLEYGRRELERLSFSSKVAHFSLEQREHGAFFLVSEGRAELADPGALERLLGALSSLSSERFLEAAEARSALGDDPLRLELEPSDHAANVSLTLGGACPTAPEQVVLLREQQGKQPRAACLTSEVARALRTTPDVLQLAGAFSTTPDAVEELTLTQGSQKLELARKDKAWILRAPVAQDVPLELGNQRVSTLIEARGVRKDAQERARLGLEPAAGAARVQIAGADEAAHREESVRVGKRLDDGRVCVERQLDRVILCFDKSQSRAFEPDAGALRDLRVLGFAPSELRSVTVDARDLHERLVREDDGTYRLAEPSGAQHDGSLATELVQSLGALQALRWAGDGEARFGSPTPAVRVRIELAAGARELLVGDKTAGGYFARIDDGPAFVLGAADVSLLETPLLDRTLCPFVTSEVQRIELRHDGRRLDLVRRDDVFRADGWNEAKASELAEAVTSLRADRALHLGPARAGEGFDGPRLEIRIVASAGKTAHLVFGARATLAEGSFVYARLDGTDATFAVATRTVLDLEAY